MFAMFFPLHASIYKKEKMLRISCTYFTICNYATKQNSFKVFTTMTKRTKSSPQKNFINIL